MTQPSGRPAEPDDPTSVSERTRRLVEQERIRREAAQAAGRRRARSPAGVVVRGVRWLRNRQTGPLPRLRRMGVAVRDALREPRRIRRLPEDVLAAALAPVRVRGTAGSSTPPARTWEEERDAARRRLLRVGREPLELAELADLRCAAIADGPLAGWLRQACQVALVRPEDWRPELEAHPPHFLLVESAWHGNGGAWQYRVAWYAHPDALLGRDLRALVAWCAARDIPSLFWDTAGAASGDRFAESGALFDLVVAPDAEAAGRYFGLPARRGAGVAIVAPLVGPDGLDEALGRLAATAGIRFADRRFEPLDVAVAADRTAA